MTYQGYPIITTGKLAGAGDQSGRVMLAFGDLRSAAILGSRREVIIRVSMSRKPSTQTWQVSAQLRQSQFTVRHLISGRASRLPERGGKMVGIPRAGSI